MAFTMAELRGELQNLGYGSLPDEFIASSLSQLQLGMPQSWDNNEKVNKGSVSSSSSRADAGGKSSRQVHGDPVPGDREFAEKIKYRGRSKKELGSTAARNGGLDSVCFTPGFATELEEMRKMLKIVHGTKEELFGLSPSSSTQKSTRKRVGLADEHKLYVGNLLDQWRVVGKTIRGKRNECASVDVGALPNNITNVAASFSKNGGHDHTTSLNSEDIRGHWHNPQESFLESNILPPAEAPSTSSRGVNKCEDGRHPQPGNNTRAEIEEQGNGSAEGESLTGKVEMDHHHEEGTASGGIIETDLNGGGVIGVAGNDITGPDYKRQVSSSAISPGVSYQPGGMLYPENFSLDANNEQPDLSGTNEETPPLSPHDAEAEEDNPSSPSQRSSAQTQVLDKLSAHPKDPNVAAFQQSLDDLDPRDTIEREKFGNVNQKIPDRTPASVLSGQPLSQQPVDESPNPLNSGVPPVSIRTTDRRGGGGAQQSPLNDRSNLRIAVEVDPAVLSHSRTKLKKKTEALSPAALKRNSSVTLKRSRSSRENSRRNEIGEEANDAHSTDIVEGGGRGDFHLRSENTTPPRSLRKLRSERVPRYPISEISPKVTIRNKSRGDESYLDIPSLGLSPIEIREQSVSPRNNLLSSRERSCVANGYTEHRLGSHCSACYPPATPTLRKSGETNSQSSTSTSKSPVGRNRAETVLSDTEASPQPKRSSVKKEAAGGSSAKQKYPLKKSSAGPSGIYTPLVDPKKTDVNSNSKVLLKTRRLASSMEFASDTSRLADRRSPSLRSSTESSRSSDPQRAPSSQSQASKSLSGSSPYARSSSFGSRSSTPKDMLTSPFGKSSSFSYDPQSSTTKDTLTPGGRLRGGKVDRVARVLEEMRPSTEPPPFVVPTLHSHSEGVCIF